MKKKKEKKRKKKAEPERMKKQREKERKTEENRCSQVRVERLTETLFLPYDEKKGEKNRFLACSCVYTPGEFACHLRI